MILHDKVCRGMRDELYAHRKVTFYYSYYLAGIKLLRLLQAPEWLCLTKVVGKGQSGRAMGLTPIPF